MKTPSGIQCQTDIPARQSSQARERPVLGAASRLTETSLVAGSIGWPTKLD